MSNSLQIQSYQTSNEAITAASQAVLSDLLTNCKTHKKVLLAMPGGSSSKVLTQVAAQLKSLTLPPDSFSNVLLIVGDERWPIKNNTEELLATGFIQTITGLGAEFFDPRQDLSMTEAANQLSQKVAAYFSNPDHYIIIMVGMGSDGHLLSANVDYNAHRFANLFQTSDLTVAFHSESNTAHFPDFPNRVTLTLTALTQADQVYVLVAGKDKRTALKQLANDDLPLHLQPAQILKNLPATIYTDQQL